MKAYTCYSSCIYYTFYLLSTGDIAVHYEVLVLEFHSYTRKKGKSGSRKQPSCHHVRKCRGEGGGGGGW